MNIFRQDTLKLPRNLRESELQDWYLSSREKGSLGVVSRRYVLVGATAAAAVTLDPFNARRPAGFKPAPAHAIAWASLIPVFISVLELLADWVQSGDDVTAELELDNSKSRQPQQGSLLSAIYDDRAYVDSAVDVGTGLYHSLGDGPPVPHEGDKYAWDPYVRARSRVSMPVAMPTRRRGDKRLEVMAGLNARSERFRVV
ncbi:hypothetical protein AB0T83_11055 [Fluviibacterium sp. DFM31]|uniref:Uncharacterized protein n=1 Tax=Meridianimarinicoccus marinus TaxID=3231483 RepID=A0ABV3L747_9RHOB